MEGLKEVDENENKDNFDKLETEVVADVAKDEGGGDATYKTFEPTANSNPDGISGGLGLVDDGNNDLGSYWREMGFVWGHQGTTSGLASNDFLTGASYYPHPHPGTSPFYAPAAGGYSQVHHMYPHGAGPASTLSRGSSRDDLASISDAYAGHIFEYEDRFRVDRRKLELLMMNMYPPVPETAADFFGRIEEETGTVVIWPSRLKIGAKSKKDPHIRVGGPEFGVKLAKSRILQYFETKSNRVTMKMDVSYTDHSHIIGKGGNTIRRVMAETNCHIHFPDSNRSNPNEKSNQVSIAGELDGVETARARVRELTPLVICFDLPIMHSLQNAPPDPADQYLRAIQEQYVVQVTFRQKQKNFHTTMVVVKGCEWEAARVKEATLLLMEHLCGSGGTGNSAMLAAAGVAVGGSCGDSVVTMNMEISPQHHPIVLGKNNITLKLIMHRTNTTILFPDAGDPNIPSIRKGSVIISGSIHNVYLARQQLIGSLPLLMMFDLPDDVMIDDGCVQGLQEELDVSITIKPKSRQANKTVIIRTQERNGSAIYKARAVILGLDDEPVVKATIPECYNIQAVSTATTGMTLPVNHRTYSASSGGGYGTPNNNLAGAARSAPSPGGFTFNFPPPAPSRPSLSDNNNLYPPQPIWGQPSSPASPLPASPSLLYPPASTSSAAPPPPRGGGGDGHAGSAPPPHPFAGVFSGGGGSTHAATTQAGTSSTSSSSAAAPWFPNTAAGLPMGLPAGACGGGGGAGTASSTNPPLNNALVNHPLLQAYALLVHNHITRLDQQQQDQANQQAAAVAAVATAAAQQFQMSAMQQQKRRNSDEQQGGGEAAKAGDSGNAGDAPNLLHAQNSPPVPGTSPRNSSPVHNDTELHNLSSNFEKLHLNSSSGSTSGIGTQSEKSSSFASGGGTVRIDQSGGGAGAGGGGGGYGCSVGRVTVTNGNEFSRAPGCEKKMRDYDTAKYLATRAMHHKVSPSEVRTPTHVWAGQGFSSSMPEAVIREKLDELEKSSENSPLMQDSIAEEDEGCPNIAGGNDAVGVNDHYKKREALVEDTPENAAAATAPFGFCNSSVFEPLIMRSYQERKDSGSSIAAAVTTSAAATAEAAASSVFAGTASSNSGFLKPSSGVSPGDDLPSVFAKNGLAKYTDLFLRHEIDLETFAQLNEPDLKEIGVQTFGARKKLACLANSLKLKIGDRDW